MGHSVETERKRNVLAHTQLPVAATIVQSIFHMQPWPENTAMFSLSVSVALLTAVHPFGLCVHRIARSLGSIWKPTVIDNVFL